MGSASGIFASPAREFSSNVPVLGPNTYSFLAWEHFEPAFHCMIFTFIPACFAATAMSCAFIRGEVRILPSHPWHMENPRLTVREFGQGHPMSIFVQIAWKSCIRSIVPLILSLIWIALDVLSYRLLINLSPLVGCGSYIS
jgi:hypothetical protein